MRCDNGGEYVSKDFESILVKNKIGYEKSCPYSPHQNGTAERGWRTLFNLARCLLIDSKIPRNLWTYAVMAAAFIRNRCFHQRTSQTPYYMLTGKKPDVGGMHVFGSVCYPYQENAKKLEPRSSKCLFVGYDKDSPAYLTYNPTTKRVSRNRCVKFFEKFQECTAGSDADCDVLDDDFPGTSEANTAVISENQNSRNLEDTDNEIVEGRPKRNTRLPPYLSEYVLDDQVYSVKYGYESNIVVP